MQEPESKSWLRRAQVLIPIAAVFAIVAFVLLVRSLDTSADGIPREGFMAIREDLGKWNEDDDPLERSSTTGDELHLTVAEDVWTHPDLEGRDSWAIDQRTAREDFDDFSAAVEIRGMDADPEARGCLEMRVGWDESAVTASEDSAADSRVGHYTLNICISEQYGVFGWWRDFTDGRTIERYLWFDEGTKSALHPLDEWNRLKVIAKGRTLWVFLNGEYVGAAMHGGPPSGAIGITIEIPYGATGAFAFRDLEIRRLGWI